MQYPTLAPEDAEIVLANYRREGTVSEVEPIVRGSGDAFDQERVEDLVEDLRNLRRELGEPEGGPRDFWAKYEGRAAALVHRALELPVDVAADPGVWRWLVFGRNDQRLIKIVDWRHGKADEPGGARDGNYGLTNDLGEGLFSRLWFRADIAYDPRREDPYELAYRGDQDLWRSHILRQEYGHVRKLSMALLCFQYPDESPETRTVSNDEIRLIAKELRRRHANLAYELLSDVDAEELIRDVRDSISRS